MTWIKTTLSGLNPLEYATLQLIMAGVGGYLAYLCYISVQQFRHIHGIATSRIRSASQGYVELKGLGEWMAGDQIHAPFSQKRCLWYCSTIEKKERSRRRTTWTNISNQTSDKLFQLVDETGQCVIDPEDAHVVPECCQTWYGNSPQDTRPDSGISGRHLLGSIGFADYRFTEQLILPASQIYVLGLFKTIADESITQMAEALVKHWKIQPHRYLSKYDTDNNGVIQKQEWTLIRQDARNQVLAKLDQENQPLHLLSRPKELNKPVIISTLDEEQLVFSKKLKSCCSGIMAFLLIVSLVKCFNLRPYSL
jgi:hypothetical protein